ncbi:hypothetical protein ACROYT_G013660 [Oculina patagonica]
MSIPRLELCGAVLAAQAVDKVAKELDMAVSEVVFYTDSKVVLGYIRNESRRFYVYIANRVEIIRKISTPDQWRYVESSNNPANLATRSLQAKDLTESDWLSGPAFLRNTKSIAPVLDANHVTISADDPEVRKEVKTCVTKRQEFGTLHKGVFEKFSSRPSLRCAIAVLIAKVRQFKQSNKADIASQREPDQRLSPEVVTQATNIIIKTNETLQNTATKDLTTLEIKQYLLLDRRSLQDLWKGAYCLQTERKNGNGKKEWKKTSVTLFARIIHLHLPAFTKECGTLVRDSFESSKMAAIVLAKISGYITARAIQDGCGKHFDLVVDKCLFIAGKPYSLMQASKKTTCDLYAELFDKKSYVFMLLPCFQKSCTHVKCQAGEDKLELKWFPNGPSLEYFSIPIPDPNRPWGADCRGKEKATYVLLWIGKEGLKVFNSFELNDEEKAKTDTIFNKFTKYLEPKSNFRIARFQLQGFRQTKDESVDSFMARCKLQAQKCRFSEAEMDEHLIEQLIIGTRERKVQENLLGKDERLKLDNAMDIARSREATPVNDMKYLELQGASAGTDEANIDAVREDSNPQCGKCGLNHGKKRPA